MHLLGWIILFTAIGGFLSALAASIFLVVPDRVRTRVLPHLVSFATGALLSAALLGLLPHAVEAAGVSKAHELGMTLLGGLLLFFVLEKMVLWRHCHADVCEVHVNPEPQPHAHVHGHHHNHVHAHAHGGTHDQRRDQASAMLILIGDGFHNVLDGVLIAAAFMTDVHLGIVTAMAVCAHEIPQEVGDLAILLNGGMKPLRALTLNLLTSVTSVVGGVAAYFALAQVQGVLPYAIVLAASSFLYIAVADLIPGLHRKVDPGSGVWQLVYIVLGVAVIYVSHSLAH
ncbi:ZIP family metal transporter [Steroidobacter flavus]|uniref:ZIP family metal transporter n=1 Tax=Steroidobacter flavus TaxID=1842136 RepID=A0ABV8SQ31_9GAMM